ncbi:MAG: nucleotidyltransferase family protein [Chromatiales bacterium]|nr:nucleotidyltransferase family protein [Chromatiales bacterium]
MRAMILAAGRGARMEALTAAVPKPLLEVGGRSLIVHTIERLKLAGINDIVINYAYRGQQIVSALGDGTGLGVSISYAPEPEGALDTGGGIYAALPLLGTKPFVVVNADIWTDFPFARLPPPARQAHLVLVRNPEHHPEGDFALAAGLARRLGEPRYTYSGISVFQPEFFARCEPGRFALAPVLRNAMDQDQVTAELHEGKWVDVGTPERLAEVGRQTGMP